MLVDRLLEAFLCSKRIRPRNDPYGMTNGTGLSYYVEGANCKDLLTSGVSLNAGAVDFGPVSPP